MLLCIELNILNMVQQTYKNTWAEQQNVWEQSDASNIQHTIWIYIK